MQTCNLPYKIVRIVLVFSTMILPSILTAYIWIIIFYLYHNVLICKHESKTSYAVNVTHVDWGSIKHLISQHRMIK